MPIEIDEDLVRFEADIRQLKIQYEQYFGGGKKRPPTDVEWRIELIVKRYGDRGAEMNFGQRFRYTNLVQTYTKYREIFRKRLQQFESGASQRHFGAAAKAIERDRAARATTAPSTDPSRNPDVTVAEVKEREPQRTDQLYETFRQAMEQSGQGTDKLSRESFEQFVQQKTEQFRKQQGGRDVEFFVSVEDGKPRLKARIKP